MTMTSIIVDEDENARRALKALLHQFGYQTVLEARDIFAVQHLIKKHEKKISLILSSWESHHAPDFPLAQLVSKNRTLNLSPLINLLMRKPIHQIFWNKNRLSRVDGYLCKPFGYQSLENTILEAHRRRAELRQTLLLLGQKHYLNLSRSLWNSKKNSHWTEIKTADSPAELREHVDQKGFYIGGILIDPESYLKNSDWKWLGQFKKTPLGLMTPVVCLSQKGVTQELRKQCDLFTFPLTEWGTLLNQLHKRVLLGWEFRRKMIQAREALRKLDFTLARRFYFELEILDSERWEFHEFGGDLMCKTDNIKKSIEHYTIALQSNPCNPHVYMSLIPLSPRDEQNALLIDALNFCPNHTQLTQMREENKEYKIAA